jgi:hypothetical protein
MNGIFHKIGIRAGTSEIIDALTTQAGLSGWWTREVGGAFTNGVSAAGDTLHFEFTGKGRFDMNVLEVSPQRVLWTCSDGPEDWIGSHIDFSLKPGTAADGVPMTLVFFQHRDWKKESDFTAHCSMKWATFLLSLRNLVETGHGQPAPGDIKIDDMN